MSHDGHQPARSHLTTIAVVGFFLIAAVLLLSEHRAHAFGLLPYLLLIACPLLHLMHGHGSHGDQPRDSGSKRTEQE